MANEDAKRRAAYVPFALGGGALAVGLGLAAWGPVASEENVPAAPSVASAAPSTSTASTSTTGSATVAPDDDDAPYEPDFGGEDIGEPLSSQGASAHGIAVVGERVIWIETEGARVASAPLNGGAVTTLSSMDDDDRYGGAFAVGSDGIFWSVGDVGGAPDPIYLVTVDELALKEPALTPIATAASVDELTVAGGELYVADGGRLVKLDGKEQTLIASRPGRLVTLTGCGAALWWLEAPLSGRGEHALMTLDDSGRPVRRIAMDAAERGPMGCWMGRVVWAEDRDDGTHRIARLQEGKAAPVVATGTVTAMAVDGGGLVWAEVHGEGADAVSLMRRLSSSTASAERIGRDAGTITALAVAKNRVVWASDDGVMVHRLP